MLTVSEELLWGRPFPVSMLKRTRWDRSDDTGDLPPTPQLLLSLLDGGSKSQSFTAARGVCGLGPGGAPATPAMLSDQSSVHCKCCVNWRDPGSESKIRLVRYGRFCGDLVYV